MTSDHIEFRLPDVGEGLDQAEIVSWLVEVGDRVDRDQSLVEILTDKSQTELPSPVAGTIVSLGFAEGDIADVGELLVALAPVATAAEALSSRPVAAAQTRRAKAAPAVRRRAREAGIQLTEVQGTGPGGRITDDDLRRHTASAPVAAPKTPVQAPKPASIEAGRHPLRGVRRVTAETMERAWTVPHIHGADELDASNLVAGRRRIKELHPERAALLTPVAFFVLAVADALRRFPMMNASIDTDAGHFDVHDDINIGIAVASEAGLIVPVIGNADRLDLFSAAAEVHRLSTAARSGAIGPDDLRGGTCTISNYGALGGRFAAPIIRPPEVSIVGFGAIRARPFVVDGAVLARPTLPIAVGVDHRLIDGDVLTAFQEHLVAVLTDPVTLLAGRS